MLTLALTLSLAASPSLAPSLYEAHLSPRQGLLVESLSSRGLAIASGVRNIVAGSILTLLGSVSLTGGVAALLGVPGQMGSDRTVGLVLGWTFFGVGALLTVIGLPLLIVGIVKIATAPLPQKKSVALGISSDGALALVF